MTPSEWLSQAREELDAVRLLANSNHPRIAASRAYYAAFYAANGALAHLGEERSQHGTVIATFGQLIVKQGGGDHAAGRALNRLFDRRTKADYDPEPISDAVAGVAIEQATTVVDAVEAWLAQQG